MTARGPNDHDRLMAVLAREATLVPTSAQVERDAIVAQRRLSEKGYHRAAKLADLLIAATAHAHGLVVLHYDSDYDLITESLGWETDWAVERGSVD
jgi:predicted nucleic acid-binding protein